MRSARPAAAILLLLAAAPARPEGIRPLEYRLSLDLPVTLLAAGGWLGTELAKPALAPERCRVCEPNRLDAAVRDAVVWRDPARARRASDAIVFGLLPAGMVANQLLSARAGGEWEAGLVDVLIVAEAAAIAQDLNQLVKFAVARERPFVHYADPSRPHDPDDDLSFYSGHTTFAFAIASSAGMVSSLRGYRSAPWVWGGGMAVAAAVGWLRMGGDMHWFSDVLVGAAVGTAVGAGLPWLLHREGAGTLGAGVSVSPRTLVVTIPF